VDDQVPAQRAEALRAQADARLVSRRTCPTSTSTDIYLLPEATEGEARSTTGNMLPGEHERPRTRSSGIPRPERKFPRRGQPRNSKAKWWYHKNGRTWRPKALLFHEHGPQALKDYPEIVKEHFGTGHPGRGGHQVRRAELSSVGAAGRFIYVPAGRARGHAAAGRTSASTREKRGAQFRAGR